MTKKLLFNLFFLLILQNTFGQIDNQYDCAVSYDPNLTKEEIEFQTFRNIIRPKQKGVNQTNEQKKVRIKFWLVTDLSGQAGGRSVTESTIRAQVMRLNKLYAPHNICFELTGIKKFYRPELIYSNSLDNLKNAGSFPDSNGIVHAFDPNTLNVYINELNYSAGWWYGVARPNQNFLAVKVDKINNLTSSVLAHEIGHNFNLIHTHGTEHGVIDVFSERVTRDPNDPNYNAHFRGDYVTDTDADPGFFSTITPLKNVDTSEIKLIIRGTLTHLPPMLLRET